MYLKFYAIKTRISYFIMHSAITSILNENEQKTQRIEHGLGAKI